MNFLLNTPTPSGNMLLDFFSAIGAAFSSFELSDAADIIFLSVFFFFILRFFRGRKAGALLIGIGVCLAIVILSSESVFNLGGTNFIFTKIFEYGALALAIIFQPEIREVLQKVGSGPINGILSFADQKRKKKQMYYRSIDSICTAVSDLSRTKTGALIVISRTTKLEEIVQTGITINADVNSFLIRNLFFNKAPLHDGAIVIDESHIVAAGCLLPLTRRQGIDGDLGTRHRAAIGMSETSDAIIIVVSEETGIISVAFDCALTRNFTPDTLRNFLLKKWVRENVDINNDQTEGK